MGIALSALRPFSFSEGRNVSHFSVLDISSKTLPSGVNSENWFRNLKAGSQGKGPRQAWSADLQNLITI